MAIHQRNIVHRNDNISSNDFRNDTNFKPAITIVNASVNGPMAPPATRIDTKRSPVSVVESSTDIAPSDVSDGASITARGRGNFTEFVAYMSMLLIIAFC